MNIEDLTIAPKPESYEPWQLGSLLKEDLPEAGIAFIFVSDCRGAGRGAEIQDFTLLRQQLYTLSALDFETPLYDYGDLISGKTLQDTHFVLQEILSQCHYKNTIPVVIGGGNDLAFSLFLALNFHHQHLNYTQISNVVNLGDTPGEITEKNFLNRIFSAKNFSLKNYHHLGYQKHLNATDSIKLIEQVEFDVMRLAEMMGTTAAAEPFFRNADLVTINCDAVESFASPFSLNPQVNGLNRREICAYMKEAGLSSQLKCAGIFNFDLQTRSFLNVQLLAQMVWHLAEGINIQKSHPKEKNLETFWVLIDDEQYAFKRDVFTGLWYFGNDDAIENCLPCSEQEFNKAKQGVLSRRLEKFLK